MFAPERRDADHKAILNVAGCGASRSLRSQILARVGFTVEELERTSDAFALGPSAALVVLDLELPDGDELALCRNLKSIAPAVPIVLITSAYRSAQARLDAFCAGADAFLLEPIDPDRFVRTVHDLIQRKSATLASTDAIWVQTDTAGRIEELNQAAANLLGVSTPAHEAATC